MGKYTDYNYENSTGSAFSAKSKWFYPHGSRFCKKKNLKSWAMSRRSPQKGGCACKAWRKRR